MSETTKEVFEALLLQFAASHLVPARHRSATWPQERAEWLARFDAALQDVRDLVKTFDAIDYDVDGDELVEDLKAVLGIEEPEEEHVAFGSEEWRAARAAWPAEAERLRERWQAIRKRLRRCDE